MGGSRRNWGCMCCGRGFRWSGWSSELFGHCPRWERIFYSGAQKGMEILVGLTLYGSLLSRVIRNLWMLKEIDAPYAHVDLAFGPEGTKSASFLALNPRGGVPVLDDDGVVITESLAINLHLARKHGGALAPAGLAEDSLATMWTSWALTELEPIAVQVMMHSFMLPEPDRVPGVLAAALENVKAPLLVLEAALVRGNGFLTGERFTVADLNVACCVFYLRMNPEVLAFTPAAREWYADAMARPAAKAAFALRGD